MLISIDSNGASELLKEYESAGIVAQEIGQITSRDKGRILCYQGKEIPLEASYTDGLIGRLNQQP